jgi:hypothetical protein
LGQPEFLEKFHFKDAAGRGGEDGFLFCSHGDWRINGGR